MTAPHIPGPPIASTWDFSYLGYSLNLRSLALSVGHSGVPGDIHVVQPAQPAQPAQLAQRCARANIEYAGCTQSKWRVPWSLNLSPSP